MSALPNILPAATTDLFQDNAANTLPEKNDSGGQFADWMSRALSSGLAAKSPGTDTPEIASAVKVNLSSSGAVNGVLEKKIDVKGQPDDVTSETSVLAASGAARIVANLQPPAAPETGVPVSTTQKKSKSDAKTSDTGHSKPVENPPAANPAALPENVSVVNLEILPAQNPVPVLTLIEGSVNLPADNGTVSQPATPVSKNNSGTAGKAVAVVPQLSSSLPTSLNLNVFADATASDIAPAINAVPEISDADISQNPPAPEDVSKIQTDRRGKNTSGSFALPAVKVGATASQIAVDTKTAGMTPVAQSISSVTAGENFKMPKADGVAATDSASPESSGLPVPAEKTVALTASFADGTLAAKQDGLMGSGEKTSKIAVLAGKFLPGSAAVTARGNDLASRAEQIFTATGAGAVDQGSPVTVTVSAATVGNSLAEDVRAQALERAHDAIALHAMSLNGAGTDSLQVVIKPGAGTQLSLELRQRGDGVEVQAVLQQGDFKHLNQQWPELQQRLEQRGIKLTPLVADGTFANGGNGEMFQQRKNQLENQLAGSVTEMSFAASSSGTFTKPAARAVVSAGWETWA